MRQTTLKKTVSYSPTRGGYYTVRVNGRLIADRLTKQQAAYLKRRILKELRNG